MTAQEAHWGVQGDFFRGQAASFIVDKIDEIERQDPTINGDAFNGGIVRFKANGAPGFSIDFTSTRMSYEGRERQGDFVEEIRAAGTARGVMFTNFVNFYGQEKFSAGLAFGVGVAKFESDAYSYLVPPGPSIITNRDEFDHTVPVFQAIAQVDIRPIRRISIGPFGGR